MSAPKFRSYKSFLNSSYWKDTIRRKVLLRDNFTCKCCGLKPHNIKFLQIHHIAYSLDGVCGWAEGKQEEQLNLLITVCCKCHEKIHNTPNHKFFPKEIGLSYKKKKYINPNRKYGNKKTGSNPKIRTVLN